MIMRHALTPAERAALVEAGLLKPQQPRWIPQRTAWAGKYRKRLHDCQRRALAKLHARTPLAQTDLPATQH